MTVVMPRTELITRSFPRPEIPGVRPAEQKRSVELRDKFAAAGREVLLETRLADVSIPELAKAAKSSVGGFYSRFDSKDAFFEFLRMRMLNANVAIYADALSPEKHASAPRITISEAFVDVMVLVFSGQWRGVLREAYASIPERPENWAPMNARGQALREMVLKLYEPHFAGDDQLPQRISIAVQLLFSALNNELMNPHLAHKLDDPTFRRFLTQTFDTTVSGQFAAATPQTERGEPQP